VTATDDSRSIASLRHLIASAIVAGRHGRPLGENMARRLNEPGGDLPLDDLGFDSLAWMEFCISVELASGLELTPADIAGMTTLSDVETWIARRS
jgi:acyl carrier protein